MRFSRAVCLVLSLGVLVSGVTGATKASAAIIDILFERTTDSGGGSEVFLGTYNTAADFLNSNAVSITASAIDISPAFNIAGFTYDGNGLQVVFERVTDSGGGSEVFLGTYNTAADFLNSNAVSITASAIDISPAFNIAGFTYDGKYQVVFERTTDSGGGSEVFLGTYNTAADFLNSNAVSITASAIDISPAFNIAGFNYDGTYQVVFERITDSGGGSEVFLGIFNTAADFLNGNAVSITASAIDISPAFNIVGIATRPMLPNPDPSTVPEPTAGLIFGIGLLGLAVLRRRSLSALERAKPIPIEN